MGRLHIALALGLSAHTAQAEPLQGAHIVALVAEKLAAEGVANVHIRAPIRAFPSCAHRPEIAAVNGSWSQIELRCDAPQFWRRVLRSNAPASAVGAPGASQVQVAPGAGLVPTLVLARPVLRGERIGPEDLRLVQALPRPGALHKTAQAEGRRLRVALMPDQPLLDRHLEPDFDIEEGAEVALQLAAGGIEIGISARALESGRIGDRIRVQPWNSTRSVVADIIAVGRLQARPNIAPHPAVNR
jgi:flagellar basal body P-ring formation protein FlgA